MGLITALDAVKQGAPKGLGERLASLLRSSNRMETRALRHVETLALGPKHSIYLVECDGERFLVAAGAEGLSAPVPLTQRFAMRAAPGAGER